MFYCKSQRCFISLYEIDAAFVIRCVDAQLAAVGLEFIHLLAECVIDAHRAEVFAAEGYEVVGGIGVKRNSLSVVLADQVFAFILLIAFSVHHIQDIFQGRRIDVAAGESVVRTDEHEGGVEAHRDGLRNVVAATVAADGGILYAKMFSQIWQFSSPVLGQISMKNTSCSLQP